MNNKYDYCKIVQDLLPSYIEKSTDEETNKFIEEHLNLCDKCKNIYNELLKNANEKEKTNTKKEIKYMKKYKNKMSILKTILIVILLLVVIYVGRNMIILCSIQNKASKYYNSNNYHIEMYSYNSTDTSVLEVYKKDNKFMQRASSYNSEGIVIETLDYTDGRSTNVYIIDTNGKKFRVKSEPVDIYITPKSVNYAGISNLLEFLLKSVTSQITTVKCNGKDCYKIDTLGMTTYVDKETGLAIRVINTSKSFRDEDYSKMESSVDDIFFEFNEVTDEDFIEPDRSDFKEIDIN